MESKKNKTSLPKKTTSTRIGIFQTQQNRVGNNKKNRVERSLREKRYIKEFYEKTQLPRKQRQEANEKTKRDNKTRKVLQEYGRKKKHSFARGNKPAGGNKPATGNNITSKNFKF